MKLKRQIKSFSRRIRDIFRKISIVLSKRTGVLLLVFVLLYGVAFSYLSLVKYYTFHATAWDLGIFSQSFYTTLNGHGFFYNNIEFGSHFHVHFSPVLILLLPFYSVYQSPVTLLILQAFAVAFGAVPLYYLASHELNNKVYSLIFAVLYLLYPTLHGANLFDFHPEKFAPLFIFSTLYFFKNNKWGGYFVFLILSLATKEDVALIAVSIGLYGLFTNMKPLFKRKINKTILVSLLTILIGFVWLFVAFKVMNYFVQLDGYEALWNGGYSHHTGNIYTSLGGRGGLQGVISYILTNPLETITQLLSFPSEKFFYFAILFLPLCMTPWFDILSTILFLPTLLEYMLASRLQYFSIAYQYPALLIPSIFAASLNGLRRLSTRYEQISIRKTMTKRLLSLITFSTLATLLFTTPIILNNIPLVISEKYQSQNKMLSLIPLDTNPHILTQNDCFPHASNSLYSYAYWNTTNVEYILIDVSSQWYTSQNLPDEFVAKYGMPNLSFVDRIEKYVTGGQFGLIAQSNCLLLFKEGYRDKVHIYASYNASFDWHHLLTKAIVLDDPTSISQKVLLYKATNQEPVTFWFGPYVTMPPGRYEAKFRLKIADATDRYILTLDVVKNGGSEMLAKNVLLGGNFSEVGVWQDFTLSFQLKKPSFGVEFRGINVSNATSIYLDHIMVTQIVSPPQNGSPTS